MPGLGSPIPGAAIFGSATPGAFGSVTPGADGFGSVMPGGGLTTSGNLGGAETGSGAGMSRLRFAGTGAGVDPPIFGADTSGSGSKSIFGAFGVSALSLPSCAPTRMIVGSLGWTTVPLFVDGNSAGSPLPGGISGLAGNLTSGGVMSMAPVGTGGALRSKMSTSTAGLTGAFVLPASPPTCSTLGAATGGKSVEGRSVMPLESFRGSSASGLAGGSKPLSFSTTCCWAAALGEPAPISLTP